MKRAHPVTLLHAVYDVLFDRCLFGVEATQTVPHEEHRKILLPWRLLQALIYLLVAV